PSVLLYRLVLLQLVQTERTRLCTGSAGGERLPTASELRSANGVSHGISMRAGHNVPTGEHLRPMWRRPDGYAAADKLRAAAGDGAVHDVPTGGDAAELRDAGLHELRRGAVLQLGRLCRDDGGSAERWLCNVRCCRKRELRNTCSELYVASAIDDVCGDAC